MIMMMMVRFILILLIYYYLKEKDTRMKKREGEKSARIIYPFKLQTPHDNRTL